MTRVEVVKSIQRLGTRLGKKIITRKDIRTVSGLENQLRKYFSTIGEAIHQAGLETTQIPDGFKNKLAKSSYKQVSNEKLDIATKPVGGIRDNAQLGTAAEYYVVAELLYRGYNATRLPMDSGLDVFAVRDGREFYLQVKNLSLSTTHKKVDINKDSFMKNRRSNDFYVIVILENQDKCVLVLPNYEIERVIKTSTLVDGGKEIRLRIKKDGSSVYINDQDLSYFLNNWNIIR